MAIRIIQVSKAERIVKDEVVPGVNILINKDMPDLNHMTFPEMEKFYEREAESIYSALKGSLPGGTMHQLLIKFLQNYLNVLKVKLEDK